MRKPSYSLHPERQLLSDNLAQSYRFDLEMRHVSVSKHFGTGDGGNG